jgi:hypothetical protein
MEPFRVKYNSSGGLKERPLRGSDILELDLRAVNRSSEVEDLCSVPRGGRAFPRIRLKRVFLRASRSDRLCPEAPSIDSFAHAEP